MSMTCFVAMPIGSGESFKKFHNRFELLIKPAVELDEAGNSTLIKCYRSDSISKSGSITKEILEQLYYADIVIVDLSELNHNVFYELGVRHGLRNKTIAIAHKGTKLPFDLQDYRVIFYEDRMGYDRVFVPEVRNYVQHLVKTPDYVDSPVAQTIPDIKEQFEARRTDYKEEITQLKNELAISTIKLSLLEDANRELRDLLTRLSDPLDNILQSLNSVDRKLAEQKITNAVRQAKVENKSDDRKVFFKGDIETILLALADSAESQDIYDALTAAVMPHHMKIIRSNEESHGSSIMDRVYDRILMAGLVIADLTSRSENVLFVVGIAHALGKELILITKEAKVIPFDIRDQRTLIYHDFPELRETLRRYLDDYRERYIISRDN
jgi:hypothetical protein